MQSLSESKTKKLRLEYGKHAWDVQQDIFTEGLNKLSIRLKKRKNILKMSEIEENTKEQSNSKVWKEEGKKRLTSSNFWL